ncbi:lipid transporter ATP-binding/permease [Basilea psittacipulmonis DSM 24701]|uniref:Lipid transporter ATP-binding/permease n=1 Tax=Basilea psittacipulmonis DSM 24701 TaxID=1072685 RepID=A0A077DF83_9BURK|nr:lipid transporter ATP-binding/permease [Basilea psittacipulmonis DSM 24701]
MRKLAGRVTVYWKMLILAMGLTFAASSTQAGLAYIMKPLLDNGFDSKTHLHYVWMIPCAIVGLFLLRGILSFCADYCVAWIVNNVLYNLRRDMYAKLISLPDSVYQKGDSGRILNRFIQDVNSIASSAVSLFTNLVREVFVIISVFGLLLYLSWRLTLIIIILMPIIAVVSRYFSLKLRKTSRAQINLGVEHTTRVKESIDGQREIKLFMAQDFEMKRYDDVNREMRRQAMKATAAASAVTPVTQLMISVAVGCIIGAAIYQSAQGYLTVGSFMAFCAALLQIFDPIKRLTGLATLMQNAIASTENVYQFLDELPEKDTGKETHLPVGNLRIEYQHVSFTYPGSDHKNLDNINLVIEPGETVAFVGRSGGGKTTLVNTLPRFIDIDEGKILIADKNIHDISLHTLREHISLVSQKVFLFKGTIAQNVAYGTTKAVSDEEIEDALKVANLWDHIKTMPNGIHTEVGEDGSWLSGGQRQRLAIARAMIKNAPILILDEATSALDNESERLVQAAMDKLMVGRSTLVIAHRLSTIKNADKIAVVNAGKIIEFGTHDELMKKEGHYAHLYQLQFNNI